MNEVEKGFARYLDSAALKRLQGVRIGIAGAGGLGSNCAMHLVRCGFRKFVLADFDLVEHSNLNRQYFFASQVGRPKVEALAGNMLAVNPDLEIEELNIRLDRDNVEGVFNECRAVVEALDDPADKKMLVECMLNGEKLLVAVSGCAGWGRSGEIRCRRVREKFYLVGDMSSEAGPDLPPMSPGTGVAAAMQADVVLAYFLNRREPGNNGGDRG